MLGSGGWLISHDKILSMMGETTYPDPSTALRMLRMMVMITKNTMLSMMAMTMLRMSIGLVQCCFLLYCPYIVWYVEQSSVSLYNLLFFSFPDDYDGDDDDDDDDDH